MVREESEVGWTDASALHDDKWEPVGATRLGENTIAPTNRGTGNTLGTSRVQMSARRVVFRVTRLLRQGGTTCPEWSQHAGQAFNRRSQRACFRRRISPATPRPRIAKVAGSGVLGT